MNNNYTVRYWQQLLAILLIALSSDLLAADCPTDIKAITDKDASVSVEVLAYQVKPLSKCELETEAKAWRNLLQKKVTEISNSQIAALYIENEIDTAQDLIDAQEDVKKAEQEKSTEGDDTTQDGIAQSDTAREDTALEDTALEDRIKTAKDAKQSLIDAKAAVKKLAENKALQKVIEEAKKYAAEQGEPISTSDNSEDARENLKTTIIKRTTALTNDRTVLIDRLNIVLTELEDKGGEVKDYETYITAVSGLKVDVTDASATWTTITGWLMSTEGGLRWALNLLQFIVILVVFYFLSIIAGKATARAFSKSKHFTVLLRDFMVLTARRVIFLVGLFIGLSALEVNIGPVLAIVGAAGFVIAFALQNSLSNFASGILMLIYRPFDIGDWINVAGTIGSVDSMNLLSTQLRMADNQLVIVPNNSVWGDVIINMTGITQRRIDLVFGIGYNDDIDKAQEVLQDIVDNHELILKEPEPIVRLNELADSSVNFVCRPWVKPADYWDVYWDVTREVKRRFDSEDISIPFPQRDVHFYQEVIEGKKVEGKNKEEKATSDTVSNSSKSSKHESSNNESTDFGDGDENGNS